MNCSATWPGGRARLSPKTLLVAAVASVVLAFGWMSAGPISDANAGAAYFCNGAWLAPYGQGGDRCYGPGQYLTGVQAISGQHSVCVNATQNGNLVASWNCAPVSNWAGMGFDGSRWLNPVVRNNTTGAWTQVATGIYLWP
jgi:hypothetical protein